MAVTLPSDIVADVIRNADPTRYRDAVARLQSASGGGTALFSDAIEQTLPASSPAITRTGEEFVRRDPSNSSAQAARTDSYRGFEHMVLRNLFETLLPDEKSGAFGGGPSAGVWRSMAADQFAGAFTDKGGIGIERMLATSPQLAGPAHQDQWPYFVLEPLGSTDKPEGS